MSAYNLTNGSHWSTAMELDYVDNLVSGRWMAPDVQMAEKDRLLRNYIKSATEKVKNKTFGTVDGLQTIEYAKILLNGRK